MAKRGAQPALYEMMRAPRASAPSSAPTPVHEPAMVDSGQEAGASPLLEKLARCLTPGRVIRLPVGYLFLTVGITLILIFLGYIAGFQRGGADARDKLSETMGVNEPFATGRVQDPLGAAASAPGPGLLSSGRDSAPLQGGPDSRPAGIRTSSQWGPIEPKSDPRVKGWTYYILAETTAQGASRLAEFCRSNGLETYVIPANNGRRKVIAFPGFQGSALSAEATAIKERIMAVGVKFKRQNKNAGTDLSDAYPSPYAG
jgi:hypothetical protein